MQQENKKYEANGWYVLLEIIRNIFQLFQTGNIVGAALIVVILYTFYLTFKLTPEMVQTHLVGVTHLLAREKLYLVPMLTTICLIAWFCFYRCNLLKKEIKRLRDIRSQLMHGLKEGELSLLDNHHPSKYTLE